MHPTMLSEKELQDVTMVFRSLGDKEYLEINHFLQFFFLESRLEEGTIHPSVNIPTFSISFRYYEILESTPGYEEPGIESLRAGRDRYPQPHRS